MVFSSFLLQGHLSIYVVLRPLYDRGAIVLVVVGRFSSLAFYLIFFHSPDFNLHLVHLCEHGNYIYEKKRI